MDERTKSILAIEQKMADEAGRIDGLLRGLGQVLLERSDDDALAAFRTERDKIDDETARLDETLRQVEKDVERVSGIDAGIAEEERLNRELKERITATYPELGRLAVEDDAFSAFASPYKTRIAAIQQKIDGLSERLDGANGAEEKGNVFAWLGKSAQNLVVKSFLAKTQSSLERVYAEAGAEFARNRPAGKTGSGEIEALYASVESLKNENNERDLRLIALKEEKRNILSSFGREGNANRKKAEIARRKECLRQERDDVHVRLGKKAEDPSTQFTLQSLFDDEMNKIRENIARHREQVKDYEDQIASLKASLEIDREQAEVKKLERSIAEQRQRITLAGETIARHEKAIAEANKRIEDLMNGPGKRH
ncbi:MAG: hypothetical protein LBT00_11440 [Spirochaetaceae bacterium]|jgi:chromosome segregation ATPase|nr:hypothetical protein [Spirochaetaceae bacterium]